MTSSFSTVLEASDHLEASASGVYYELFGGEGNDFIDFVGSASPGLADGGPGNDTIKGSASDNEIYGGSGNDTIDSFVVMSSVDFVDGGSGNDIITASGIVFGGSGNDNITTFGANDRIDCEFGNDECDAGNGNDKVFGGAGNDFLSGGANRDILVGGTGRDTLNGGDTNADDIFRYTSVKDSLPGRANRDTIVFSPEDIIDLARIDANTHRAGDQKFTFIGDDAFSGKSGELRITGAEADHIISGDVNGDRKADFQIHVIDVDAFFGGNFVL